MLVFQAVFNAPKFAPARIECSASGAVTNLIWGKQPASLRNSVYRFKTASTEGSSIA